MSSIRFTTGSYLTSSNVPSPSGDWTVGGWYKFASANYTSGFPTLFSWDNSTSQFMFIQTEGSSGDTTKMAAGIYDNPSVDERYPLTGSSTSWVFVSLRHTSGSSSYTLSYRLEGQSSLTSATLSAGGQLSAVSTIFLGTDGAGELTVDGSVRSFFARSDRLSDADLLTASSSLSAPAGTNHTFLPLNSLTGTGTNLGTGGNYTVSGTPSLDASEPNPAISGGTIDASASDSVSVTDSLTETTQYLRSASDTLGLTDSVSATTALTINVSASDAISVTDGTSLELDLSGLADAVSVTDAVGTSAVWGRSGTDTVSVTDAVGTSSVFAVAASDAIDVTDQGELILGNEDITIVDTVAAAIVTSSVVDASASDSAVATDAASTASIYERLPSDVALVSDTVGTSSVYGRAPADTASATDAVDAQLADNTITVNVSDVMSVTEAWSTLAYYLRSGADSAVASDAASSGLEAGRSASDTVSASDAASASPEYGRALADSVSVADVLASVTDYVRGVADTSNVTDLVTATVTGTTWMVPGRTKFKVFPLIDLEAPITPTGVTKFTITP